MKLSLNTLSLGLTIALVVAPISPVFTRASNLSNPNIAEAQQQQAVTLSLKGEKREVRKNAQGLPEVVWISLDGTPLHPAPRLQPGDVVRYTLIGTNNTDKPINGLKLENAVPRSMAIVLNSARADRGQANLVYSIDGGKTYVARPVVQERGANGAIVTRAARAEEYTHVRWIFTTPIPPKGSLQASYHVRLR